MKTLLLAATTILTLGAGSAIAESGDGWDMPYVTPAAPTTLTSKAPAADRVVMSHNGATFVYGSTSNYVTSPEDTVTPRSIMPATPRFDYGGGYPVTWGGG
jgi:hypothetical protein